MRRPEIVRVEVERDAESGPDFWSVSPIWGGGVDRPNTGGYIVKGGRLAARLESAMLAGVVYEDPTVKTDVNGKTYVAASSRILGRTVNADLRRLGF